MKKIVLLFSLAGALLLDGMRTAVNPAKWRLYRTCV